MSESNDGGPAFPVVCDNVSERMSGMQMGMVSDGMTLRDYFAAKAMQGFISQPLTDGERWREGSMRFIATDSYEMADEMLKASGR